jgi:hypothetical protein
MTPPVVIARTGGRSSNHGAVFGAPSCLIAESVLLDAFRAADSECAEAGAAMANDTIVDIYCPSLRAILPGDESHRSAPGQYRGAAARRQKLFDLDERFGEMDRFGDYRQIISLPNPPIEDLASGAVSLNLARIGNDAMAGIVRAPS